METIIGLFENRTQVESVILALRVRSISPDDVTIVMRDGRAAAALAAATSTQYDTLAVGDGADPVDAGPEAESLRPVLSAIGGGIVGGLTGLWVGLGMAFIPGLGPIVAAGPIGTALAGTLTGLATGGVLGTLIKARAPLVDVEAYRSGVERGAILVVVRTDKANAAAVQEIFDRHSRPLEVHRRLWEQNPEYDYGEAPEPEEAVAEPAGPSDERTADEASFEPEDALFRRRRDIVDGVPAVTTGERRLETPPPPDLTGVVSREAVHTLVNGTTRPAAVAGASASTGTDATRLDLYRSALQAEEDLPSSRGNGDDVERGAAGASSNGRYQDGATNGPEAGPALPLAEDEPALGQISRVRVYEPASTESGDGVGSAQNGEMYVDGNDSAGSSIESLAPTGEESGVSGPHAGRGPRGYQASDRQLWQAVCERLAAHGELDASDVEISVHDREVTLRGTVPSEEAKHLAEDLTGAVAGVRFVSNELSLRGGTFGSS